MQIEVAMSYDATRFNAGVAGAPIAAHANGLELDQDVVNQDLVVYFRKSGGNWEAPSFQNNNDFSYDDWNDNEAGPEFTKLTFGKPSGDTSSLEFSDLSLYNVAPSAADLETLSSHTQYGAPSPPARPPPPPSPLRGVFDALLASLYVDAPQYPITAITQRGDDIDGEANAPAAASAVALDASGTILAVGAPGNSGAGTDAGHVRVYAWSSPATPAPTNQDPGPYASASAGTPDHSGWPGFRTDSDWSFLFTFEFASTITDNKYITYSHAHSGQSMWIVFTSGKMTLLWAGASASAQVTLPLSSTLTQSFVDKTVDFAIVYDKTSYLDASLPDAPLVTADQSANDVKFYYRVHGDDTWMLPDLSDPQDTWEQEDGATGGIDDSLAAWAVMGSSGSYGTMSDLRMYDSALSAAQLPGPGSWAAVGTDVDGEAAGDKSGTSVALSADGEILAIGAPGNGDAGANAGHVRVYELGTGTWVQIGADLDGDATGDEAGTSVALSTDGTVLAVGAPGNGAGRTRVYEKTTAIVTRPPPVAGHLTYDDTTYTLGGSYTFPVTTAVTIARSDLGSGATWDGWSSDKAWTLYYKYTTPSSSTAIHVNTNGFMRFAGGTMDVWRGTQTIDVASGQLRTYYFNGDWTEYIGSPSNPMYVSYGFNAATMYSIAVAFDGTNNAGSQPDASDFKVYIRDDSAGGDWSEALMYTADADTWTPDDAPLDMSGQDLVLMSPTTDWNGPDYGSLHELGFWNAKLDATQLPGVAATTVESWQALGADLDGEAAGDAAGTSVALSSDGSVLAVGAPGNAESGAGAGHARVYELTGGTTTPAWAQLGADLDGEAAGDAAGTSVALSADGTVLAVGAPGNGDAGADAARARVRAGRDDCAWVQRGADIDGEAAGDQSGTAVALSADGQLLAVGAPSNDGTGADAGHARVYLWIHNEWVQMTDDVDAEAASDLFGHAVALDANGETLAVGAANAGHVRVYDVVGNRGGPKPPPSPPPSPPSPPPLPSRPPPPPSPPPRHGHRRRRRRRRSRPFSPDWRSWRRRWWKPRCGSSSPATPPPWEPCSSPSAKTSPLSCGAPRLTARWFAPSSTRRPTAAASPANCRRQRESTRWPPVRRTAQPPPP